MTEPNAASAQSTFTMLNSPVENLVNSGVIYVNKTIDTTPDELLVEGALDGAKKVLLFLAANPVATQKLRLDEEVREIEAGLRRSQYRDRFELKQQWAVRPIDLWRAMLECKPSIVHFSGHGVDGIDAGLLLEDATGRAKLVGSDALSALFKLFANSVDCVILNACYSERQARAIAAHIPYVIGMNQAIGDRAAIEFAVGFYDALGAGESIQRAHKIGSVAVQLAGIPEHLTPVMVGQ
jgi:CHAT domain-containing protein